MTIPTTSYDASGIETLVSVWRTAGLLDVDLLTCHEGCAVVQVGVADELETEGLDDLESVGWWDCVGERAPRWRYVIECTAPKFPPRIAVMNRDLIDCTILEVSPEGMALSLIGPQQALSNVVTAYERAGLAPELRQVGTYTGRDRPLDLLTERQREVLMTASEMGYFDVPRTAGSEAIGAKLGIDASTVTEHLQRAERNLVSHLCRARQR